MHDKIWVIVIGMAILTLAAAPLAASRSQEDPSFDPSGEIYETLDLAADQFEPGSPLTTALFIIEGRDGDALTRETLLEFVQNSAELRADSELSVNLAVQFRPELGEEVDGIFSLADKVDDALPGGLETASDADVKLALAEILGGDAVGSPLRDTLSQLATSRIGTVGGVETVIWTAPALNATLVYDLTGLGGRDSEAFGGAGPDAQQFLRDAQSVLQGEQESFRAFGVAIDGDLTAEEQLAESSPFILLSVVGIMLLVGGLLRSYWAAAVVAAGLAMTMIWYAAVLTALGFEGGMLLGFIGPISVIAFGVDFFVHASGRAREHQVDGHGRSESYALGLRAVFPALVLAVASSAAAFISNAVSGIQAIVQFGIGTAIALIIGFTILGIVTPRVLLAVEDTLGESPLDRGRMISYKLGFVVMALFGGMTVTMSVVVPIVGVVLLALFVPIFIYLPIRRTRKIYANAAAAGRPTGTVIKGAGHGFKAAGDVVHFLARWRVVTIPVVVVLAVLGGIGFTKVDSEFSFSDFFAEDSDFITSIDLLETHYGDTGGGGQGFIYVAGDLTQPSTHLALDAAVVDLDAADAASSEPFLSRDLDGAVVTEDNATTIVRAAVASTAARSAVETTTGVAITDNDRDGLADTSDQIAAIFDHAFGEGIVNDDGFAVFTADNVPELVYRDGAGAYATLLVVGIPTLTDEAIVLDARAALDAAAADLEAGTAAASFTIVSVSGETITQIDSLNAFTRAMLIALPVALLLCALIAMLFMRSVKYGLAAVSPILLVVGWIYGFMYLFDYKINVVTATIAAIAVGVGIDYSTHFTMRFREEFENEPSRFPALRRAGEGTGGALAISALSSIIGFTVMAFAPMPIFVTFGVLTAVMIFFSLTVSLLVLPSVLLLVTPSRTGTEREELIDRTGLDSDDYHPHERATAQRPRATV
ncbi:MMPL family transporter [Ilumatobacter sp.]|uniref:MMPL family transporter n=1 Tax=Ilumatobacter sp. TaxID=1967498 RepID=UPI003AF77990